jgi:hypothetical protein
MAEKPEAGYDAQSEFLPSKTGENETTNSCI